uniref:LRIM1/APL1C-like dimerization domain-containing protein n=1 Tax=Anopheles funestus TaxID=62324 RepID=A0A182RI99_ANOFN
MVPLRICTVFIVLVCATSAVHGAIHQVKQLGSKYKIEKVTDSTLSIALASISSNAWNVKELDLSGNVLSQINVADLQQFTQLELLNLSSNVFYETLDLQMLSNLKTVDLNNNFVKEVFVASSIETLHAANNNISRVRCFDVYRGTQSVKSKKIYLANNKIGSLLDLDDACRKNVAYLDLQLNEIDVVDFAELADSAYTLKYLYLEFNFIFDVKNTRNVVFSNLDTLDLSSNKLAFMGPEFMAAVNARSINLSNNKLVLIEKTLKFSNSIASFDLRGNGFHCDTVKTFFKSNSHLKTVATTTVRAATGRNIETCTHTTHHSGPFCCEDLTAPFADRLIELKRKEHGLFSGQPSEKERAECEQENKSRQKKVESIRNQFGTHIDAETRRNREKIQLAQRKKALEEHLPIVQNSYDQLKGELVQTAGGLNVTDNPNLLELLHIIVQKYEDLYVEEQNEQRRAIRDIEMYHQQETQLLEENARLKKLNGEADEALQKVNATLQNLVSKEELLTKKLNNKSAAPQNV